VEYTYIRVPLRTNSNFFYVLKYNEFKASTEYTNLVDSEKTGVAKYKYIISHYDDVHKGKKKYEMKNVNNENANAIMHIQIYLAPADENSERKKDKQKYQRDNTNTTYL
jgi:hypothetical protein